MSVKLNVTQVALTTAAAVVKAANTDRKGVTLQNDSAVDMLWGDSSTTCFNRLQPGEKTVVTSFSKLWAKTASSTGNMNVSTEAEV